MLDVATGKVAHTLAGHAGGTNVLAFLTGNSLVSVGEDGAARLWNVARATCQHELPVDAEGADRWAGWGGEGRLRQAGRLLGSAPQLRAFPLGVEASAHPVALCSCPQSRRDSTRPSPHASRAGRRGHSVNHLTVAPGAKSFACAAGRLITIFRLGDSPQQPPSKRVLGPLDSTVGARLRLFLGVAEGAVGWCLLWVAPSLRHC